MTEPSGVINSQRGQNILTRIDSTFGTVTEKGNILKEDEDK